MELYNWFNVYYAYIYSIYINTCTCFIFTLLEFLGAYVSHLKKLVKLESFSKFSQWKWSTWNVEVHSCVQNHEAGCYKYKQYVIYAHRVPTKSPWHFPACTISWTHDHIWCRRKQQVGFYCNESSESSLSHRLKKCRSMSTSFQPPPHFSYVFPIGSALQPPQNMVASNASASAWRPSPVSNHLGWCLNLS